VKTSIPIVMFLLPIASAQCDAFGTDSFKRDAGARVGTAATATASADDPSPNHPKLPTGSLLEEQSAGATAKGGNGP
jgi:hypothetical protein